MASIACKTASRMVTRALPSCSASSSASSASQLHSKRGMAVVAIGSLLSMHRASAAMVYDPGQTFVHETYGYRGVVLHAWRSANVYSHGMLKEDEQMSMPQRDMYYAVARDARDETREMQKMHEHNGMFSFVPHSKIVPYRSLDTISNAWTQRFFKVHTNLHTQERSFTPTQQLSEWHKKIDSNQPVCSVYRNAVPDCVTITVVPRYDYYAEWAPHRKRFKWNYNITIENTSQASTIQLVSRRFKIVNLQTGEVNSIAGPGVVGCKPVLRPGEHFVYESSPGPVLQVANGYMAGAYTFEVIKDTVRQTFDVELPTFRPPPDV